jgi:hypothetical protein
MFKKLFNRTIGEVRKCRQCGEEFHTHKPIWSCMQCLCKQQKLYPPRIQKKEQYPFKTGTNQSSLRFSRIHGELSKAWKEYYKTGSRDALTKHYDNQLQEIRDNGIMDWINDRRDNQTKRAKFIKSRNTTNKDFPDTRGHYEY